MIFAWLSLSSWVVARPRDFCSMGQFGVCLVSLRLLNHKTALSTYCIQGVMLSILRDGAFVLIFKSMALYVAFYGIAFKWSVHRLWDKGNLGTVSDPPAFCLCDFGRRSCPLCLVSDHVETVSGIQLHDYAPASFFLSACNYFTLGMDRCIHHASIYQICYHKDK